LEVFEKVIIPACQAFSIDPVRADQIAASGAVTEQVLRHLYEDEVVIADVSGGNPNVMYELGLRHTRNRLTILIGEYGQLPFDIADIRTIQFSKSDRGLIDARKELERALLTGLAELPEPIAATRIWNSQGTLVKALSESTQPTDASELEEVALDEKGLMERLATMEDSFPILTSISEKIASVLGRLGDVATSASAEINVSNVSNPTAKGRLNVIAKFARSLQPSADELSEQTTQFQRLMSEMDEEMIGLLSFIEGHPEVDDVDTYLDSVVGLAKSTGEAMESIGGFGVIVESLADLSQTLRRPSKQIVDAVKSMTSVVEFTDEWDNRARRIKQARSAAKVAASND